MEFIPPGRDQGRELRLGRPDPRGASALRRLTTEDKRVAKAVEAAAAPSGLTLHHPLPTTSTTSNRSRRRRPLWPKSSPPPPRQDLHRAGRDPSTDTTAEFAALTYTEIGLAETLGEFGDESNNVNFTALGDARVRKAKGARDAGTLALTVAHDPTDAARPRSRPPRRPTTSSRSRWSTRIARPRTARQHRLFPRAGDVEAQERRFPRTNVIRRTYSLAIDSQIFTVPATARA